MKNAADKQLKRFEKEQSDVQESLQKLIAKQAKANQEVEHIAEKYKSAEEKVRQAKAAAQAEATSPDAEAKSPKIDPETGPTVGRDA